MRKIFLSLILALTVCAAYTQSPQNSVSAGWATWFPTDGVSMSFERYSDGYIFDNAKLGIKLSGSSDFKTLVLSSVKGTITVDSGSVFGIPIQPYLGAGAVYAIEVDGLQGFEPVVEAGLILGELSIFPGLSFNPQVSYQYIIPLKTSTFLMEPHQLVVGGRFKF